MHNDRNPVRIVCTFKTEQIKYQRMELKAKKLGVVRYPTIIRSFLNLHLSLQLVQDKVLGTSPFLNNIFLYSGQHPQTDLHRFRLNWRHFCTGAFKLQPVDRLCDDMVAYPTTKGREVWQILFEKKRDFCQKFEATRSPFDHFFRPPKQTRNFIGIKNFEMKKFPRERKLHQGGGHSQNAGLDSAIASSQVPYFEYVPTPMGL